LRVVIQRVSSGGVFIPSDNYLQKIGPGIVVLLGIKTGDSEEDVNYLADKCCNLRCFNDENKKMNLSVKDINGEALIISQFTLYGDTSRGNRPGYSDSAKPDEAIPLYESFISRMEMNLGTDKVKRGIFGAMMEVKIINDGPVTLIIDSR
jgi:D-tyrosyl-tRNA(Tyr) deacylase